MHLFRVEVQSVCSPETIVQSGQVQFWRPWHSIIWLLCLIMSSNSMGISPSSLSPLRAHSHYPWNEKKCDLIIIILLLHCASAFLYISNPCWSYTVSLNRQWAWGVTVSSLSSYSPMLSHAAPRRPALYLIRHSWIAFQSSTTHFTFVLKVQSTNTHKGGIRRREVDICTTYTRT